MWKTVQRVISSALRHQHPLVVTLSFLASLHHTSCGIAVIYKNMESPNVLFGNPPGSFHYDKNWLTVKLSYPVLYIFFRCEAGFHRYTALDLDTQNHGQTYKADKMFHFCSISVSPRVFLSLESSKCFLSGKTLFMHIATIVQELQTL